MSQQNTPNGWGFLQTERRITAQHRFGGSRLIRETICSLSGLIILQHLSVLLLGEDAAPRELKLCPELPSSFRRKGLLA